MVTAQGLEVSREVAREASQRKPLGELADAYESHD